MRHCHKALVSPSHKLRNDLQRALLSESEELSFQILCSTGEGETTAAASCCLFSVLLQCLVEKGEIRTQMHVKKGLLVEKCTAKCKRNF